MELEDIQEHEDNNFVTHEAANIVKVVLEECLGGRDFKESACDQWSEDITAECIRRLTNWRKNFKYVVTCCMMQKNGAGLHSATSAFWDNTADSSCSIKWENKSVYALVSVFGCTF